MYNDDDDSIDFDWTHHTTGQFLKEVNDNYHVSVLFNFFYIKDNNNNHLSN